MSALTATLIFAGMELVLFGMLLFLDTYIKIFSGMLSSGFWGIFSSPLYFVLIVLSAMLVLWLALGAVHYCIFRFIPLSMLLKWLLCVAADIVLPIGLLFIFAGMLSGFGRWK
ncbi:MAG TPA: hypothetical protein IAB21_06600 [Candidatus Avelusimicrobium excrementipullorum]|nr:hypothetical protein [Candidatus Avelusimicrobium excrementipullorum]